MKKIIGLSLLYTLGILVFGGVIFIISHGFKYTLEELKQFTERYGLFLQWIGVIAVIYGINRKLALHKKNLFNFSLGIEKVLNTLNTFVKSIPKQILYFLENKSTADVKSGSDTLNLTEGPYKVKPEEHLPKTLPEAVEYFNKKIEHVRIENQALEERMNDYFKQAAENMENVKNELNDELEEIKSKIKIDVSDVRIELFGTVCLLIGIPLLAVLEYIVF